MDVSVVIACFNGTPTLRETLNGIVSQRWDRPWELVLADNGSTDDSIGLFNQYAAANNHISMRIVDASGRAGKSYAVNMGVAAAKAPAVVICDQDDVPAAGWLQAMGEALRSHDFVAAHMDWERLNTGPMGVYRRIPGGSRYRLPYPPYCSCVPGTAMGFTKRLHATIGGFDPTLTPEDDEFCARAHLHGFVIHPVPEAVIHYRLKTDTATIFRQALQYSMTDVRVAQKYHDYGPPQEKLWLGLIRRAKRVAKIYYSLRIRHKSSDMVQQANLQFQLGAVAGQLIGILKYRSKPTFGKPPRAVYSSDP